MKSDAGEKSEDIQAEIKEDLKTLAADVKAAAEEKAEEIKAAAEDVKAAAEEKAEEVKAAAEDVKAAAEEKAEDVKAAAEEKAEEVKEAAKDVKDAVEEKAEDVKTAVEEKTEDVKEAAEDVKAAVEEKAEDVKAAAEKTTENIKAIAEGAEITTTTEVKETSPLELLKTPMTLTEKVTLNKENLDMVAAMLLGGDEGKIAKLNQVIDFVNGMEYKVLYDGKDAEGFISTKGEDLSSFLMQRDENGVKLYSDMFPSYFFEVRKEEIQSILSKMPANTDPSKLGEAFAAPMLKMMSGVKFGAPETVEETLFDTEFTTKTPIDMTLKEMALLGLNTAKEVMENEETAKLLASMKDKGVDFSVDQIDQAIKAVEESKDEEIPAVDAGMYTNANNDMVFKVDVTQNGELVSHSLGGKVGDSSRTEVQIGNQAYVYVKAGNEGVDVIIRAKGMEFGINAVIEKRENGRALVTTLSMMGMEMVKSESEVIKGATLTGKFDTEGKQAITIKDLKGKAKELAKEMVNDAKVNYMPVLKEKIQKIAPEMMPVFSSMEKLFKNTVQTMAPKMVPQAIPELITQ